MTKSTFKSVILLLLFAAILVLVLTKLDLIVVVIGKVLSVLNPFIVGFVIAYIVNIPYVFFKDKVFAFMEKKPEKDRTKFDKFLVRLRKPLAIIVAFALFFAVIVFLVGIIVPQISNSLQRVVDNFGSYYTSFQEWVFGIAAKFGFEYEFMSDIFADINEFTAQYTGGGSGDSSTMIDLNTIIQSSVEFLFPQLFDITKNVYNILYNGILSIIVSIYYIGNKETLLNQTKKVAYSYIPQKLLGKVLRIVDLCNNMVGKFIYGKIVDSTIIGILCFITLKIVDIEYAALLSIIVGVTNIIPFFGPIIGAIPGVVLLLMISPFDALLFGIIIIIIQQLDGNLIGPMILGDSIGISGFWIMFSILVGGGLFGFVGMLLSVPIFAVIYFLMGEKVNDRLVKLGYATKENVRVDPLPKVAYEDGHIIADDEVDDTLLPIFEEDD